ncbi:MAG: hypothetical protein ACFNJK_09170, partial [Haemophilus parainfluenzae]
MNSKISQGYYRISCAEFRRTEPTTHNLVINLYQWGSAQAQPIKRFYAGASGDVTFYLDRSGIDIPPSAGNHPFSGSDRMRG